MPHWVNKEGNNVGRWEEFKIIKITILPKFSDQLMTFQSKFFQWIQLIYSGIHMEVWNSNISHFNFDWEREEKGWNSFYPDQQRQWLINFPTAEFSKKAEGRLNHGSCCCQVHTLTHDVLQGHLSYNLKSFLELIKWGVCMWKNSEE